MHCYTNVIVLQQIIVRELLKVSVRESMSSNNHNANKRSPSKNTLWNKVRLIIAEHSGREKALEVVFTIPMLAWIDCYSTDVEYRLAHARVPVLMKWVSH